MKMEKLNFHILESKKINSEQLLAYKEYRRRWTENPKNHVVDKFPIHIELESTSACNLKCIMCFQSYAPPEKGFMEPKLFSKIIHEGADKGLCSCKLQWRGEPLLHPQLAEMVKCAKDEGLIEVMFNTNATLLTEKRSLELIGAGLDKIICSVDGYTKDVYEKIRVGGKFEDVLNNIKTLQRLKKERNLEKPVVRVQMVDLHRKDIQIKEYVEFWGKIADVVAIGELLDLHCKERQEPVVCKDFICQQLWQRLFVTWNGEIRLCCSDYSGKLTLGNAYKDSISEIWTSEKLNRLRQLHVNGESHRIKMCNECYLRDWYIRQNKD